MGMSTIVPQYWLRCESRLFALPGAVCNQVGMGIELLHGLSMVEARLPQPKSSQPTAPGPILQSGTMASLLAVASAGSTNGHCTLPIWIWLVPSHVEMVNGKVTGRTAHPASAAQMLANTPVTAVAVADVLN